MTFGSLLRANEVVAKLAASNRYERLYLSDAMMFTMKKNSLCKKTRKDAEGYIAYKDVDAIIYTYGSIEVILQL